MGLYYEVAGGQIDGARDYQEDAYLITHLKDSAGQASLLVIVADGMGGHAAGNVASNMAVQAFNKHVTSAYPDDDLTGLLQGGVLKANASIADTIRETPALQGMGCTMVAVLIEDGRMWWASVGDSHLYLLRDKELSKKNADHSYGGFLDRLAAAGQPMHPEPGLSRNMLMSAITGEDIVEIDCPEAPQTLQAGDRVLLCSDGLDTLSAGKIIQFAEWSKKARDYTDALLNAVNEAALSRQDNATALVVDILSTEPEQAESPVTQTSSGLAISEDGEIELTDEITIPDTGYTQKTGPGSRMPSLWPVISAIGVAILVVIGIGLYQFWPADSLQPLPADIAERIDRFMSSADPEPESEVPQEQPDTIPDEPPVPAAEVPPTDMPASEPESEAEPAPAPAPEPVAVEAFSDTLRSGGRAPAMVWIPAGKFKMGSSRFSDERPEHQVEVSRFAMSRHEITIAEYRRFARATGRPMPNTLGLAADNHPMINVTWQDAVRYTEWLSQQTGQRYRLPSEAEWEYAAAAGSRTDYWWGVNMEPDRAYCFGCEPGLEPSRPTQIGSYAANPYGLYDMQGNVAEWVADCWHANYQNAPATARSWTEGGDCNKRVVRGGSYNSPPTSLRTARRDRFDASDAYDNIGFRVVREAKSQ